MKRAFTLVEVLVVVGILALLAAILFPVFSRARENARRTTCISNAKQIFLAHSLYKEDCDGVFAPAAYRNEENRRIWWLELFAPYARDLQVFRCPSDTLSVKLSFGLNTLAFADVEYLPPPPGGVQLGALRYERPAESVLASESGTNFDLRTPVPDAWKVVPPSFPIANGGDARPSARHFDRATVLWMDGHVKSLPLAAFYQNQTPTDRFFAP